MPPLLTRYQCLAFTELKVHWWTVSLICNENTIIPVGRCYNSGSKRLCDLPQVFHSSDLILNVTYSWFSMPPCIKVTPPPTHTSYCQTRHPLPSITQIGGKLSYPHPGHVFAIDSHTRMETQVDPHLSHSPLCPGCRCLLGVEPRVM